MNAKPMNAREACEYLGLKKSYLHKLTSQGKIPHFKSQGGKLLYFDEQELKAWATAQRKEKK